MLLQCAVWNVFRPAEDAVGALFGSVGGALPATARRKEYTFTEPVLGHGGASGGDDPNGIGEERDAEGDARVEVLADEVVTVVQGSCEEFNLYFGRLGTWFGNVDEFESDKLTCQQPKDVRTRCN